MGERPEFECPRGEDRGVDESMKEGGMCEWVSPPHWRRGWEGAVPPQKKKSILHLK